MRGTADFEALCICPLPFDLFRCPIGEREPGFLQRRGIAGYAAITTSPVPPDMREQLSRSMETETLGTRGIAAPQHNFFSFFGMA